MNPVELTSCDQLEKNDQSIKADLGHKQLDAYPSSLLNRMTSITELSLSSNRLHVLPEAISKLQNLNILLIGNNCLTSLPNALCHLPHLKTLVAHNNQITELPLELGGLISLETCKLPDNQLTSLPRDWTKLSNILLDLNGNPLNLTPGVRQITLSNPTACPECHEHVQNIVQECTVLPKWQFYKNLPITTDMCGKCYDKKVASLKINN